MKARLAFAGTGGTPPPSDPFYGTKLVLMTEHGDVDLGVVVEARNVQYGRPYQPAPERWTISIVSGVRLGERGEALLTISDMAQALHDAEERGAKREREKVLAEIKKLFG